MAPKDMNELLKRVKSGRRAFLRQVLAGTAFAAPLMSSFSMRGLSFPAARAQSTCGEMMVAGNMQPRSTTPNVSAAYTGPTQFRARLTHPTERVRAAVDLKLSPDRNHLIVRVRTSPDALVPYSRATFAEQWAMKESLSRIVAANGTWTIYAYGLASRSEGWILGMPEGPPCSLEDLMKALAAGTCVFEQPLYLRTTNDDILVKGTLAPVV